MLTGDENLNVMLVGKTQDLSRLAAALLPLAMCGCVQAQAPSGTRSNTPRPAASAGCNVPKSPADPGCATSVTPANPRTGVYVLDWEDASTQTVPEAPPRFWRAEYCSDWKHTDDTWQVALEDDPALVRSGRWSVRFQLDKRDPLVSQSKRAELKANRCGYEAGDPERWYGFSIHLPDCWQDDPDSSENLAQWHQADSPDPRFQGSPPLALMTRAGRWYVSMRKTSWNDQVSRDTDSIAISPYKQDLGKWTDWVVHVRWSADPQAGVLQVWKNGKQYPLMDAAGQDRSHGQNKFDDGQGNYMKIGIYKWDWKNRPERSKIGSRVIYYDDLRIAAGPNRYNEVVPPPRTTPPVTESRR
jgi:polysaccharide lyase-like protein